MPDREPTDVKNLSIYGDEVLPWSRAQDLLNAGPKADGTPADLPDTVLGTVRSDGRPHAALVGSLWHDGDYYICSSPASRKSRNLETQPACTISVSLGEIDLVFEGEATRVTDSETLQTVATRYSTEAGWPAEVKDGAFAAPYSAPSAGPPPWYLYRFTFHTAFGVGMGGSTRWRFTQ